MRGIAAATTVLTLRVFTGYVTPIKGSSYTQPQGESGECKAPSCLYATMCMADCACSALQQAWNNKGNQSSLFHHQPAVGCMAHHI